MLGITLKLSRRAFVQWNFYLDLTT